MKQQKLFLLFTIIITCSSFAAKHSQNEPVEQASQNNTSSVSSDSQASNSNSNNTARIEDKKQFSQNEFSFSKPVNDQVSKQQKQQNATSPQLLNPDQSKNKHNDNNSGDPSNQQNLSTIEQVVSNENLKKQNAQASTLWRYSKWIGGTLALGIMVAMCYPKSRNYILSLFKKRSWLDMLREADAKRYK